MVITVQVVYKKIGYKDYNPYVNSPAVTAYDLSVTVPVESVKEFSDTLISMFRNDEKVMALTPCNPVTEALIGNVVLVALDSVASINIAPVDQTPVFSNISTPIYPGGTGGN